MDHQPKFFENLSGTGKAIGVLTSGGDAQGRCARRSLWERGQEGGKERPKVEGVEGWGEVELRTRWGVGVAEREGEGGNPSGDGMREAGARRASQAVRQGAHVGGWGGSRWV